MHRWRMPRCCCAAAVCGCAVAGATGVWCGVTGVAALYGGIRPALVGTAVSMGIYFYAFEVMKKTVVHYQKSPLGAVESLLLGYVAGCINVTLTCPIWVVTACMQAHKRKVAGNAVATRSGKGQPSTVPSSSSPGQKERERREREEEEARSTVSGTVKEILRESGPKGFFKGSDVQLRLVESV